MTDRELLERAAKAAGYTWVYGESTGGSLWWHRDPEFAEEWNPLTDDGDALRLAVRLRIDIAHFMSGVRADVTGYEDCYQPNDGDPYAATRRAIVRAAAEMAK